MDIKLEKANLDLEYAYYDFINEWNEHHEEITPYSARLLNMNYIEWLELTKNIEKPETCPENLVPAYTYFLTQNKRIIGAINIRHYLNNFLFNFGGHIWY